MKWDWASFTREDYLRMIDRQWPFWSALDEFVLRNGISSAVEVGCGIGHLCHRIDAYTGIDVNQSILTSNERLYRKGTWLCGDWMTMDWMSGELFLAVTVLEHIAAPLKFLDKSLKMPFNYAVVTFPARMRDSIEAWAKERLWSEWSLFDLPVSRRPRQVRQVCVLVIDRVGGFNLEMWNRKALHAAS